LLLPWKPSANSVLGVFALSGSGTSVLAGGDFTKIHGTAQQGSRDVQLRSLGFA
jgi:hypothetical protein